MKVFCSNHRAPLHMESNHLAQSVSNSFCRFCMALSDDNTFCQFLPLATQYFNVNLGSSARVGSGRQSVSFMTAVCNMVVSSSHGFLVQSSIVCNLLLWAPGLERPTNMGLFKIRIWDILSSLYSNFEYIRIWGRESFKISYIDPQSIHNWRRYGENSSQQFKPSRTYCKKRKPKEKGRKHHIHTYWWLHLHKCFALLPCQQVLAWP